MSDYVPRILLVEDEESLLEAIRLNLEMEDYEVVPVSNGSEVLSIFRKERFNLIVLDVMLPGVDGFTLCEKIRLEYEHIPILFLTAKDTSTDRIRGFKVGADDYLTKPFNLEELLLRVRVLLRHHYRATRGGESLSTFEFGDFKINFNTREAEGINGKFSLTKKEAQLLKLLVERKNQTVSREQMLEYVWGYDVYPSTRTIDNFMLNFRKHFEADPKNPKYFQSVRGVGYRFVLDKE
ncbi:MAG: response regulator transcription factor [Chitinophagales bacterium]